MEFQSNHTKKIMGTAHAHMAKLSLPGLPMNQPHLENYKTPDRFYLVRKKYSSILNKATFIERNGRAMG